MIFDPISNFARSLQAAPLNKKKTKSLKKVKLVYRKSLQSIILLDFWERTEQTKIVVFIPKS